MGLPATSRRIDHLGIAVASLAEAVKAWEALGFPVGETHDVPTEKVRAAFLAVGESRLELLEPTEPSSVIARFLEKRSGLHHVCVLVDDLDATLAEMKTRGVELVDEVASAWRRRLSRGLRASPRGDRGAARAQGEDKAPGARDPAAFRARASASCPGPGPGLRAGRREPYDDAPD